jgi:hypothetical protein
MTHVQIVDRIIELCEVNGHSLDIHYDMRRSAIKIKHRARRRGKSFTNIEDALHYLEKMN